MTNITNLTTSQLNEIIAIKEQIEALQSQIDSIAGGGFSTARKPRGARKMSRSAAARIAVAARWAKVRAAKAEGAPEKRWKVSAATKAKMAAAAKARWAKIKGKRRLSAAGRAAISAAAKARWARVKAEGRKTLYNKS